MERERGTVVMFKTQSGYGFIQPITNAQDLYFHISDWTVPKPVELGMQVTYVVGDRNGRPIARQITPVDSSL